MRREIHGCVLRQLELGHRAGDNQDCWGPGPVVLRHCHSEPGKRSRPGLSLYMGGDKANMRSSWHVSPHSEARPPGLTLQVCHMYAV